MSEDRCIIRPSNDNEIGLFIPVDSSSIEFHFLNYKIRFNYRPMKGWRKVLPLKSWFFDVCFFWSRRLKRGGISIVVLGFQFGWIRENWNYGIEYWGWFILIGGLILTLL